MGPSESLNASFWVAVVLRTFGAVDMPGTGKRQMPAPYNYVPLLIAWGVLQIVADAGWERPAAKFGLLLDLATLVLPMPGDGGTNPTAKKLINLTNWVAQRFGVNVGNTATQPALSDTTQTGVSA